MSDAALAVLLSRIEYRERMSWLEHCAYQTYQLSARDAAEAYVGCKVYPIALAVK